MSLDKFVRNIHHNMTSEKKVCKYDIWRVFMGNKAFFITGKDSCTCSSHKHEIANALASI